MTNENTEGRQSVHREMAEMIALKLLTINLLMLALGAVLDFYFASQPVPQQFESVKTGETRK